MQNNVVFWNIGVDGPVAPDAPLPAMPDVPRGTLLVIGGRGPVWRYGLALHQAHGSAAAAVATYDPRLGAVVVATHCPTYQEGQVVEIEWPS